MRRELAPAAFGLAVGLVLFLHGSTLGPSDDEAYYWVLAGRPALGYAYHPPAIAWLIWVSERLFGAFLSPVSVTRLPAAACAGFVAASGLRWAIEGGARPIAAALALLSFGGFFGAAWMAVPDLPLFAGWALLFIAVWECPRDPGGALLVRAAAGSAILMLSKYSGALAVGSAIVSAWLLAERTARGKLILAILSGALVGAAPWLAWNAAHGWESIAYQLAGRHTGGISWTRFARFWLIEAILAGPILIAHAFLSWRRAGLSPASRFAWIWGAPPLLVFGLQPLFADFKPHWIFAAWLPYSWELARTGIVSRLQISFGLLVLALGLLVPRFPVISWVESMRGATDPLHDVGNDLRGWEALPDILKDRPVYPVLGARYQTASQAAMALGRARAVSLVPKGVKEMAEWPEVAALESQGPGWPRLKEPVNFVSDARYSSSPGFIGASCQVTAESSVTRWSFPGKTIRIWTCFPESEAKR